MSESQTSAGNQEFKCLNVVENFVNGKTLKKILNNFCFDVPSQLFLDLKKGKANFPKKMKDHEIIELLENVGRNSLSDLL